jgi:hypothetical protein
MTDSHSTNISFPSGVLAEYRWRCSFQTDFIAVWVYLLSESHTNTATDINIFAFRFLDLYRLNTLQK